MTKIKGEKEMKIKRKTLVDFSYGRLNENDIFLLLKKGKWVSSRNGNAETRRFIIEHKDSDKFYCYDESRGGGGLCGEWISSRDGEGEYETLEEIYHVPIYVWRTKKEQEKRK